MTANELADLIENEDTLWLEPHLNTIATMLRQQAKEIELLKLRKLTNEEIASVCKEHLAPKNCDIYTFARAILQKASEE